MSYTGFFADTDLYRGGQGRRLLPRGRGSFPVERADGIAKQHFVMTEDPITHERVQRRYRGGGVRVPPLRA